MPHKRITVEMFLISDTAAADEWIYANKICHYFSQQLSDKNDPLSEILTSDGNESED
jgi:hypothetical protein